MLEQKSTFHEIDDKIQRNPCIDDDRAGKP